MIASDTAGQAMHILNSQADNLHPADAGTLLTAGRYLVSARTPRTSDGQMNLNQRREKPDP